MQKQANFRQMNTLGQKQAVAAEHVCFLSSEK